MRALALAVFTAAVLVTAAACSKAAPDAAGQPSGSASAPVGVPSGGAVSTSPPEPTSTATRGEDGKGSLDAALSLVASGGIAGGADTITVAVDGSWSRDRGGKVRIGTLSDAVVARLNKLIGDEGLAEGATAKPGAQCPDMIRYTLTVADRTYRSGCDGMPNDVFAGIVSDLREATS